MPSKHSHATEIRIWINWITKCKTNTVVLSPMSAAGRFFKWPLHLSTRRPSISHSSKVCDAAAKTHNCNEKQPWDNDWAPCQNVACRGGCIRGFLEDISWWPAVPSQRSDNTDQSSCKRRHTLQKAFRPQFRSWGPKHHPTTPGIIGTHEPKWPPQCHVASIPKLSGF